MNHRDFILRGTWIAGARCGGVSLIELRAEIERLIKETTDPQELEDLYCAYTDCLGLEMLVAEGDAENAWQFGYQIALHFTRFEARAKLRHRTAKGGYAKKKMTPEQEQLALKVIMEKKAGLGKQWKRAACVRAAAELQTSHNINVSKDTLLRLLRSQE